MNRINFKSCISSGLAFLLTIFSVNTFASDASSLITAIPSIKTHAYTLENHGSLSRYHHPGSDSLEISSSSQKLKIRVHNDDRTLAEIKDYRLVAVDQTTQQKSVEHKFFLNAGNKSWELTPGTSQRIFFNSNGRQLEQFKVNNSEIVKYATIDYINPDRPDHLMDPNQISGYLVQIWSNFWGVVSCFGLCLNVSASLELGNYGYVDLHPVSTKTGLSSYTTSGDGDFEHNQYASTSNTNVGYDLNYEIWSNTKVDLYFSLLLGAESWHKKYHLGGLKKLRHRGALITERSFQYDSQLKYDKVKVLSVDTANVGGNYNDTIIATGAMMTPGWRFWRKICLFGCWTVYDEKIPAHKIFGLDIDKSSEISLQDHRPRQLILK